MTDIFTHHSALVASTMRQMYTKEEIRSLFLVFWNLKGVKGIAKESLREIISEEKNLHPNQVNKASAAQKAEWCEQLLEHAEMGGLLANIFWNVYATERARSTAALIRAKEGAPLTFEGFMKAGGLNRRDALLFLLLFLPSDLVPVAPSIHLVDQGLKLNGIMPPEPIVPENLWN